MVANSSRVVGRQEQKLVVRYELRVINLILYTAVLRYVCCAVVVVIVEYRDGCGGARDGLREGRLCDDTDE